MVDDVDDVWYGVVDVWLMMTLMMMSKHDK
jgi:hypothetical protein